MLTDNYLRKHNYLRISITDRCNLRCRYCMPPEGVELLSHDEILRNEEFIRLIGIFVSMGVTKVRFTGGEPLARRDFIDIVRETRANFPDLELCLTTNGTLLGDVIDDLRSCELKKLNISLDTLSRERYELITRRDLFGPVIENIDRALDTGFFDVKINAVLFEETLDELDRFLDHFSERNVTLRFIERMPFTEQDETQTFLGADDLVAALSELGTLKRNGKSDTKVAVMYDLLYREKYPMRIGIIPPMTHKFCSSCNRLRLTSFGSLKTCLYSNKNYNLRDMLRESGNEEDIRKMILQAVRDKAEGHSLDCCAEDHGCHSLSGINSMSKIGG